MCIALIYAKATNKLWKTRAFEKVILIDAYKYGCVLIAIIGIPFGCLFCLCKSYCDCDGGSYHYSSIEKEKKSEKKPEKKPEKKEKPSWNVKEKEERDPYPFWIDKKGFAYDRNGRLWTFK